MCAPQAEKPPGPQFPFVHSLLRGPHRAGKRHKSTPVQTGAPGAGKGCTQATDAEAGLTRVSVTSLRPRPAVPSLENHRAWFSPRPHVNLHKPNRRVELAPRMKKQNFTRPTGAPAVP